MRIARAVYIKEETRERTRAAMLDVLQFEGAVG